MSDAPKVQLTDGGPVPPDGSHTKLRPDGQQEGYIVLSPEERAKGFVRPVRHSYEHVGLPRPRNPLRDLTPDEVERFARYGYVKYEEYKYVDAEGRAPSALGRYWTQPDLDRVEKGCGTVTTMGQALAETYARDPQFYGGTFCCGCGKHFPVGEIGEFVWAGTKERVGT